MFATARWADSGLNSFQVIFSCMRFLQPGVFVKLDFNKYKEPNQRAAAFIPPPADEIHQSPGASPQLHLTICVLNCPSHQKSYL